MNFSTDLQAKKQAMREAGRSDIIDAHAHCANHREEVNNSTVAGCFYCCETYAPSLIDEWIDHGQCAMCPKCGIDAVIGDASGFPVADKNFLREMNGFWFS